MADAPFREGFFARMMYSSLRLMHERALHGTASTVLNVVSQMLSCRSVPPVKSD
jgi:NADH dehydrogenase